jgi:putative colanic acid biosynthesis glycosyltransferase WcaI
MRQPRRKTLVIFSQTFVPDPASVGQHMADVAVEMARRGHRVRVFTSARGYEDAKVRYSPRENLHGVEIRRLPLASFGKKHLLLRVLGTAAFQLQCLLVGLFLPRVDGIFFSTSPPLMGLTAGIIGMIRRAPIAYWAMDLNPDQLLTLGKLRETDLTARVLEAINRFILKRSSLIIALDRFMAARLLRRGDFREKLLVAPPWSPEVLLQIDRRAAGPNPFRFRHGLDGRFVIMYSGNHSPSNPLTTLLDAAVRLKDDSQLQFVFVGGGHGKKEVEACIQKHQLANVLSLPYQPISELRHSLPAADVHVVSLGPEMVGIIHPCKIYGAMAVGRPVLYFGPRPSHITDLLDAHGFGREVAHGDIAGAVAAIQWFRDAATEQLHRMGTRAAEVLAENLGHRILCEQLCDRVEAALWGIRSSARP